MVYSTLFAKNINGQALLLTTYSRISVLCSFMFLSILFIFQSWVRILYFLLGRYVFQMFRGPGKRELLGPGFSIYGFVYGIATDKTRPIVKPNNPYSKDILSRNIKGTS